MGRFKIGIMADCLNLPFRESIEKCAELGADGVQLYAVKGEMSPDNMTAESLDEKKKIILGNGLVISALCADFGGHGFARAEDNAWRIEASKRILDLALEFDCRVVTTHIGVVPEDKDSETYHVLQEACGELAEYAQKAGGYFAIETGPEPAVRLKAFLDSIGSKGIAVNFDPANLVMVTGDDPVKAAEILADYIVHTHAKDGIMRKQTDPKIIYDYFAEGGIGDLRLDDYFVETPLGQGNVDFDAYLNVLCKKEIYGFLTIERETGAEPERDIAMAVSFLKQKV